MKSGRVPKLDFRRTRPRLACGLQLHPAGLRRILNERSDQFVSTMTEKLLTFALGRGAEWYDAPAIREAVSAARKDDYRFSALVTAIVSSRPFQMRMSQTAEDGPRRTAEKPAKSGGKS